MFEEMTYNYILSEMLSNVPDGLSTAEGSLLYNACAKQAARLEEAYTWLRFFEKNMYDDTADLDHLIASGNERGIPINYSTFAEFKAQFNCEMSPGELLTFGDYNYTIFTELDAKNHIYLIGCNTEGSAPNHVFCDLAPVEFKEEFEWGKIIELVKAGKDIEETEIYRSRLLANYGAKAFAGNRAYYNYYITLIDGVGGIKMERRIADLNVINITMISDQFNVPSQGLIDKVQSEVDPEINAGEGEGLAPIGHKVKILPVASTTVDIETKITYEADYTYEDLASQIDKAVEDYLLELRKNWVNTNETVVRILQIEAHIAEIQGIVDVTGTKLNGIESNLNVGDTIPIKGVLTCN